MALALVACPAMVPKATGSIPAMSFAHDDTDAQTVALGSFFADDDNATYKAESSKPAVATVSVKDATLTVTPKGPGTATVTVTATSSTGRDSATQTFSVTVASPPVPPRNNPPAIRTVIQAQSVQVGSMTPLRLSDYYLDLENDALTFTATSHNPAIASVSAPDAQSMITITAVAEGSTQITVTAADATLLAVGLAIPQTFAVTVSAVPVEPPDNNQPRQLDDIPDLMGLMFGGSQDVDLDDYFTDDDGDDVTYTAESSDMNVVTVSVSGSMVTVMVVDSGMARIDITATDPYNRSVRASFNVEVINQAPMVVTAEATRFGPYMPGHTQGIYLSRYFSDPEGNSLVYTAASDDDSVATASDPGMTIMTTITAMAEGTATITITANDGTNDAVSHELTVTVVPVPPEPPEPPEPNNPPIRTDKDASPVVLVLEDDPSVMLNVSTYFSDPDGDTLTYDAVSSDTGKAMESVSGSMVTITAVAAGSANITVTASDPEGATSGGLVISVTVQDAANLAPELTKMFPNLKIEATADTTDNVEIDLSEYFEDTDSPQLFYNVTKQDDDEVITFEAPTTPAGAIVPNGTTFDTKVIIVPDDTNTGMATVMVTATDFGNKMASGSFTVMVVADAGNNDPDAVASPTPPLADLDGDPVTTRLKVNETKNVINDQLVSAYFSDADFLGRESGETLTFSVKYFANEIADETGVLGAAATDEIAAADSTVSVEFSRPTWTGSSDGKFTVSVTGLKGSADDADGDDDVDTQTVALIATDEYGRRAAQVFQVRVNNAPKNEGAQETPLKLDDATEDVASVNLRNLIAPANAGDSGQTATATVPLVVADGGYFSDGDGPTDLADGTVASGAGCAIKSTGGVDGAARFTITETTAGATSVEVRALAVGMKTATITCTDAYGEESPSSVLTVEVTGTTTGSQQ